MSSQEKNNELKEAIVLKKHETEKAYGCMTHVAIHADTKKFRAAMGFEWFSKKLCQIEDVVIDGRVEYHKIKAPAWLLEKNNVKEPNIY